MKINDNGTIKDLVVKASDTLPIGTIVEYDGDTIPSGYEEVKDEVVLYENSSGSNEKITLSDSAENYKSFEIHFRSNDGIEYRSSVKLDSPQGKKTSLRFERYMDGTMYVKSSLAIINETTITLSGAVEYYFASNQNISMGIAKNIYITKVVGYK